MDDTEAEAVLLALADPLKWEPFMRTEHAIFQHPDGRWRRYYIRLSNVPSRCYIIYLDNLAGPVYDQAPYPTYLDYADAKAACERHYATGKWE